MRALGDSLAELRTKEFIEEERASLELAESALRFTRHAKESVDDKLSFSATLMRAGEVQAATRLIAELEGDVRDEEEALVEAINEVQAARSRRREKITRLRLTRLLITAMLGACVMGFSAMSFAVAGMFAERARSPKPAHVAADLSSLPADHLASRLRPGGKTVKHLQIGGRLISLNKEQLIAYRELKEGGGDAALLEAFLASLPSDVADTVRTMIVFASAPIQEAIDAAIEAAPTIDVPEGSSGAAKSTKGSHTDGTTKSGTPDDDPPAGDVDDDDDGIDLNTNLPL